MNCKAHLHQLRMKHVSALNIHSNEFIVKCLSARLLILQCMFSVVGCGLEFYLTLGTQFVILTNKTQLTQSCVSL